MKLLELVEPKLSHHEVKVGPNKFNKALRNMGADNPYDRSSDNPPKAKNPNVTVLGGGAYASAIQPASSHEVMKISRGTYDLDNDPYYQYITKLIKSGLMFENPFFPRVYKLKTYQNNSKKMAQTDGKKFFYIVELERLDPLIKSSKEELLHFYEMISPYSIHPSVEAMDQKDIYDRMTSVLQKMLLSPRTIKDERLRQAVDFIVGLKTGHRDLHNENAMVRRTSVGPQLVLTDPLA